MPKADDTPSTSAPKPKRILILGRLPNGDECVFMHFSGAPLPDLTEGDAITAAEVAGWFHKVAPKWAAPGEFLAAASRFG